MKNSKYYKSIAIILALLLALSGCGGIDHEDDKGPYITMYLSDEIYDFDPINAYYNSAPEDKEYLAESDKTATRIAQECGFYDVSHMRKCIAEEK